MLKAGDWLRVVNPALALALTFHAHDPEGRKQLALSLGATLAGTELAKRTFNETELGQRPDGDEYGFPSGHASTACAGAAFLQHRYGLSWALPLYATSAFTAYTRVDADRHHWRDVIAGCALAYGIAAWLVSPQHAERIEIAPTAGTAGSIGLQLRVVF